MKSFCRRLLAMCLSGTLCAAMPASSAQDIDAGFLGGYSAAVVVIDRAAGKKVTVDPDLAALRMPPCSTFKIYNTLIGLESGKLAGADDPWYRWDGVKRDVAGWNQDLTLRQAFKVSAVPAFQDLARQIGSDTMKKYIELIGYGNRDISAGLDCFWLPRPGRQTVLISADEQAALLNRLLDGQLPFAPKNVSILKDLMKALKTDKGVLYGKTGSGSGASGDPALGWFVGFLESGGNTYVFACAVTGGQAPSGKAAREVMEKIFKSQGRL